MFDYDREYAEFKFRVEYDYTTAKEKAKIKKELALFEQLDWQKYIVILPKVIQRIEEYAQYDDSYTIRDTDCSLFNTYAFLKFISQEFDAYGFPRDYKNSKESLSKSAISLTFYIQPTGENLNFNHIARCLEPIIEESGLYCSQRILNNVTASHLCDPTFQEALYIFSTSPIPISDTDSLSKENRYLLIKFTVDVAKKETDPYEELKSRAIAACTNPEDTNVVYGELDYIERRGWQKYMVVVARMLENLDAERFDTFRASFRVPCFITLGKLLGDRCFRFDLSLVDEFYVNLVIENPRNGSLNWFERILDYSVQDLGLHSKELRINNHINAVIISKSPIYKKDIEFIAKEHEQCTPEERERLSRYLIIKTVQPGPDGGWN